MKFAAVKEGTSLAWEIIKWAVGVFRDELAARAAERAPEHPTHRDSEIQTQAGRCAGHETEPQCSLPTLAEATAAAKAKYGDVPLKLVGHNPKTGWIIVPKHPDDVN